METAGAFAVQRKNMTKKEFQKKLDERIEKNKEEQLQTLKDLVGIESVAGEPEGDAPFGAGVQKAFDYMLQKGSEAGFDTFRAGNYGGHIEMKASDPDAETMGIVCHIDTVPLGEGWTYDPLGCEIHDGEIYGRGTTDDKGPCIAAFYAMKAVAQCGFPLRKNVRLILGLDEETNWIGMDHYKKACEPPDFGFTPDADFPAIRGEMGIMVFDIAKKLGRPAQSGLILKSLKAGSAPNMVADSARALLGSEDKKTYEKIEEQAAEWRSSGRMDIRTRRMGKSLEVKVKGKSAHGAHPSDGINAVSLMMEFLGTLDFAGDDAAEFIEFYNRYIGRELDGSSIGCRIEDKDSGATVFNVGMAEIDQEAARITVNVRYPVTSTADDIYKGMEPVLEKYDLGVVKKSDSGPILFEEGDPLIETLMDVYRDRTGDKDSQPAVMGGGTYARAFDNVTAFGALFPGDPDLMHQKDERVKADRFFLQTHIYADAVYRLCCGEEENE